MPARAWGFKSPLRHQEKVQVRGHFGKSPGWPFFLPVEIIARLSRGRFLEALQNCIESRGDGAVAVSCRVLVAPGGGGVGVAEASHEFSFGGSGPSGERSSDMA